MKKVSILVGAWLMSAVCQAGIIDSGDVAGYTTFQDTSTGHIWLDMDNFFDDAASVGTTPLDMITAANLAGFSFATRAEVAQLLDTLPLDGGQWAGYAAIMGLGIPRQLIWGVYEDGSGDPFGWAYAYSSDSAWLYNDDVATGSLVAQGNGPGDRDLGIFAYQTGEVVAPVPAPATLALFGLGLAGLGWSRRKKA